MMYSWPAVEEKPVNVWISVSVRAPGGATVVC